MNKARAAVDSLLSRDGKHDTSVHEIIKPAVEHEEVVRTQREELQTAVDREVHQDHYHTSVQPVQQREVQPEEHLDRVEAIENREYEHGNADHIKQRLANEAAQFKNTRNVSETEHTTTTDPTITGEHVHHHVHEIIQPVVQKETIQPSVVHHTIPIHEVHHNEAKHHTATQLPAVTMDEFKRQGGHLSGREEHTDSFQGEPKSVGGTLGGARAAGTTSLTESEPYSGTRTGKGTTTSNVGNSRSGHGTGSSGYERSGQGTGTSGYERGSQGTGTGGYERSGQGNNSTARTAASTALGGGGAAGIGGGATAGGTGSGATGGTAASGAQYGEKSHSGQRGSSSNGSKRHNLMDKLNPMKSSEEGRSGIGAGAH